MQSDRRAAQVSVSEAARRLAKLGEPVERSSLSRYIAKHADALVTSKAGCATTVDFDRLLAHRRGNVGRGDAAVEAKPVAAEPPTFPTAKHAANKSRADETAAKLRVQRELLELNLAQRRSLLTPVAEVHSAAHAAIGAMKAALAQAASDTAEAIAAETGADDRVVRPHLRKLERIALAAFLGELERLGAEAATED